MNPSSSRRRKGDAGESSPRGLVLGPGLIVAAAFVGPGTVMTATRAGAEFGLGLIWVVLLSVLSVMVLQEMTSRLGTLTGIGLGSLLRRQYAGARAQLLLLGGLILVALGFGNAAYQTGNLMGAAVGIGQLLPIPLETLILTIGAVAALLLWFGSYRVLERVLVSAVAIMGLAFVAAAGIALLRRGVTWGELRPLWPASDYRLLLALIGTTIVPYNLFLHASAAAARWSGVRPRGDGLRMARTDSTVGIALGGLVTLAILVASSAALAGESLESPADAALALESVLGGSGARIAYAIGLAAAGLTSAITAPLAAAHAISGVFGWRTEPRARSFRTIWGLVLISGVLAGVTLGRSPDETIVAAQAANALVLPVIAVIVLLACNAKLLGKYANTRWQNVLAVFVIAIVTLLSAAWWL